MNNYTDDELLRIIDGEPRYVHLNRHFDEQISGAVEIHARDFIRSLMKDTLAFGIRLEELAEQNIQIRIYDHAANAFQNASNCAEELGDYANYKRCSLRANLLLRKAASKIGNYSGDYTRKELLLERYTLRSKIIKVRRRLARARLKRIKGSKEKD